MRKRVLWVIPLLAATALVAASSDYLSAKRKFDRIESGTLKPGTRTEFTARELEAYAAAEVPAGVRNPKVQLTAPGEATGSALVDFGKLRRAQGYEPGWLMSMLLDGERPVSVTVKIRSSAGRATVDVQRVQIANIQLNGAMLDFLIQNFLIPMYPSAAVGRPFELGYGIDRIDVQPRGVGVVMGR